MVAGPDVRATKVDALVIDADSTGMVTPGDTVEYTVVIVNQGDQPAEQVRFADTPGANTALVAGTVTTTQGVVTLGNLPGNTSVAVSLGTLGAGSSATVRFRVTINRPLTATVTMVYNQGSVSTPATGTGAFDPVVTDDPDLPGE